MFKCPEYRFLIMKIREPFPGTVKFRDFPLTALDSSRLS